MTEEVFRPGGLAITDYAITACGLNKDAKILDVGCGSGVTVEHLADKYGFACSGIDLSAASIKQGLKRNPSLDIMEGDGCALPYDSWEFDAVLMECSLSLMYHPSEAIHEAFCVLKKGGFLIIHGLYFKELTSEQLKRLAACKQLKNGQRGRGNGECFTDTEIAARDECCLDGALVLEEVRAKLDELSFRLLVLEDRADDLREFMTKVIFEHGSLEAFRQAILPEADSNCCYCQNIPKKNISYFLLIAQKNGVNND